jgi:hypothetical protein
MATSVPLAFEVDVFAAASSVVATQDAFYVLRGVSLRMGEQVSPSGNKLIDSPIRF